MPRPEREVRLLSPFAQVESPGGDAVDDPRNGECFALKIEFHFQEPSRRLAALSNSSSATLRSPWGAVHRGLSTGGDDPSWTDGAAGVPQQGRKPPRPVDLVQERRPSADGVQVGPRPRVPIKHSSPPTLRTTGRLSKNEFTFTAEASDNKARFRCEASNIMSQTPLKAEVDLTVLCKYRTHLTRPPLTPSSVAPAQVTITGPSEARVGDSVPLTCTTAASNPRAEIWWMVGDKTLKNVTSRTSVSPEGGWITTSNLTAVVEPNRRSLVVNCHGINNQLSENIVSTHTINVLCKWRETETGTLWVQGS